MSKNLSFLNLYLAFTIVMFVCLPRTSTAVEPETSSPSDIELVITEDRVTGQNSDNSATFPIFHTQVNAPSGSEWLESVREPMGESSGRLQLKTLSNSGRIRNLDLPKNIEGGILKYLEFGKPQNTEICDCNCFAHVVNGVEFELGHVKEEKWETTPFDVNSPLFPGDTLLIGKSRKNWTHVAIYIGDGLFLSKFGGKGPLMVTTLNAMKIAFGGDKVWKMYPRQSGPGEIYESKLTPTETRR